MSVVHAGVFSQSDHSQIRSFFAAKSGRSEAVAADGI
jgi:hypothetical protein